MYHLALMPADGAAFMPMNPLQKFSSQADDRLYPEPATATAGSS
jgi:hypothetical protein